LRLLNQKGGKVTNYTKILAEYAAKLNFEDLPGEVIEQVKQLTLHVLGVSLAACATKQGKDVIALAQDMGGAKSEATIIGSTQKVPTEAAAFANGTLADILDWEDCSWTGHPSAGAIPAALAMGERVQVTGKEYITAVVAGYEVYQRIAMAVQPSIPFRLKVGGWGLTCWQIFAAAIPAAKLLKLEGDKMAQTIGIAGATCPIVNGKINICRSDMYHYEHGLRARDGIVSALIAKSGINSLYDMLDGDTGYWITVTDKCDWAWMSKELGSRYLILETYFKHWPVNMWVQQYLDILNTMMREDGVKASNVDEIVISPSLYGNEQTTRMIYRPDGFQGITDAEFSIPYCMAVMLVDPNPGPNWFTEEKIKDPQILKLAGKVRGEQPDIITSQRFKVFQKGDYVEAKVRIRLNTGREVCKSLKYPKGHSQNRFTPDEYQNLFRLAASIQLPELKIEQIIDRVQRLEKLRSVSELMDLVT